MKRPNPLLSQNSTELLSISSASTSKIGKRISFIDTITKKPIPKSLDSKKVIFISVCFFVFFVSSLLHFLLFASYSATRSSSLQQATLEQRRRSIDEQAVVAHRLYQLADFACEIANQPGRCTPLKAPLSLEAFFGGGSSTSTTVKMKNDSTTQHLSVIVNVAYRQEKIEIINLVVVKLKN